MWVHWKIQLLGGGFIKNQYRGGDCLKREAWTVYWFKGGWQESGDGVVEGVWYLNAYYELSQNQLTHVLIQSSVIGSNWCVRG